MAYVQTDGTSDIVSGVKDFFKGVQTTAKEGVKVKTEVKLSPPLMIALFGGLGLAAYYVFFRSQK